MRVAIGLSLLLACACGGEDSPPAGTGAAGSGAHGPGGPGPGAGGSGAVGGAGGNGAGGSLPSGWSTLAPIAGGPRQENGVAALAGEIYVIGGFDELAQVVADVEAYDPGSDTWRSRAPLPDPRHHPNVAVVGDKLFVVGSLAGNGFAAQGDVYVYDAAGNEWFGGTPMPAGTERGGAAVAVLGDTIYVAGGYRAGSVADFSAYDTATGIWEPLPDLPAIRDHLVGFAFDGKIYAVGGRANGIEAVTSRVDVFDPTSGEWSAAAPMPTARGGSMAALAGDHFFVVGGEGNAASASGVFDDVEAFSPADDAWQVLAPMQTPRHGTGAASLGGVLYVPGGATQASFGAVDVNEALVP
jgi:N-acetylneuraminic acid mutarotase